MQKKKSHWENVFQTKDTTQVSWYQPNPEKSLQLIDELNIEKNAGIIEVGAGDSYMADHLLDKGYQAITLLDISENALNTLKTRLCKHTNRLNFIAADICHFSNKAAYTVWHDRAVFHFLCDEGDQKNYFKNVSESIRPGGYLIISTFSEEGPNACSGLEVKRYSEDELSLFFHSNFQKIKTLKVNHTTPSGSVQNFVYGVFKRR